MAGIEIIYVKIHHSRTISARFYLNHEDHEAHEEGFLRLVQVSDLNHFDIKTTPLL